MVVLLMGVLEARQREIRSWSKVVRPARHFPALVMSTPNLENIVHGLRAQKDQTIVRRGKGSSRVRFLERTDASGRRGQSG